MSNVLETHKDITTITPTSTTTSTTTTTTSTTTSTTTTTTTASDVLSNESLMEENKENFKKEENDHEILFEFDEDITHTPKRHIKYILDEEVPSPTPTLPMSPPPPLPQSHLLPHTPSQTINKRKSPQSHKKLLATSVPVPIPVRLAANQRPSWTEYYEDDEEGEKKFVEPHELAAKTYHDYYLKTGFELDVPTSQTKRIKSFI